MRIVLVILTLVSGVHFGGAAIATVNHLQEKQADQLCNIDPNLCNAK